MTAIFGLIMVYAWVHSVIILASDKPKAKRTGYEKTVIIVALVSIILFIIGAIS